MFGRNFWEILKNSDWEFEATTPDETSNCSGKNLCLFWQSFKGELYRRQKLGQSYVRGFKAFDRKGILLDP